MQGNSFEITIQDEADRSLSARGVRRLGQLNVLREIEEATLPHTLGSLSSKVTVDGLRSILSDPYYPEFGKARARGLIRSSEAKAA